MSSTPFTIRKTGTPERCEICHQTDLFDPVQISCQRCDIYYKSGHSGQNPSNRNSVRDIRTEVICFFGGAGLFCGVIVASLYVGFREIIPPIHLTRMRDLHIKDPAFEPFLLAVVGAILGFILGMIFGYYLERKVQE